MNNRFKNFEPEGQELMHRYEEALKSTSLVYFDVDDLESIIDIYIEIDEFGSARKAFQYSMRVHPESAELKCKEAKILLLEGHYRKAIDILSNYDNLRPDYIGILAECNLRMHYFKKAKDLFDKYLMTCETSELEPILHDISSLFNTFEKYDYAIYYLESAVTLFPKSVFLRVERAYTYDHLHRYPEAIADFEQLISNDPYSADLWSMMASSYFANRNYQEALRAYEYAIAIKPDNLDYICFKGHCLFYLDRFKECIEPYSEFLEKDPSNAYINAFIGQAYENIDDYDNAIKHFKQSIKTEKDIPESWLGMVECYLYLGNTNLAYTTIKSAQKIFPEHYKVYYIKGIVLNRLAEETEDDRYIARALDSFLTSLNYDRENYDSLYEAGSCCLRLEEYAGALKLFNHAYKINPDISQLALYISIANYGIKDYQLSMEFLQKAKETISNAENIFLSIFPEAKIYMENYNKNK